MSAMLLSIKPKYAKVILEGKNNTNSEKADRKMVWIESFSMRQHRRRKWSEKRLLMKYWKGRRKKSGR